MTKLKMTVSYSHKESLERLESFNCAFDDRVNPGMHDLSMSAPDSRVNLSATQDSQIDGRQTRLKLN